MKGLVWLMALGLGSSLAFAFDVSKAVVKIYSMPDNAAKVFVGSGLLVRDAGKVYCLTSEHVIFHAAAKYRHRLRLANGKIVDAVYGIGDGGFGLGILAVPALADSVDFPSLADLAPSAEAVRVNERVTVHGLPFEAEEPLAHSEGYLAAAAESQTFHPELPSMARLEGSHGEFGMSGGPVFTNRGRFVGVLSHQRLRAGDVPQNSLLVIGVETVHAWLRRYLANPAGFEVRVVRPAWAQFQGIDEWLWIQGLFLSNRSFELAPKNPVSAPWPMAHDYHARIKKFLAENSHVHALHLRGFREKGVLGKWSYGSRSTPTTELLRNLKNPKLEPVFAAGINFIEKWFTPLDSLAQPLMEFGRYDCDRAKASELCAVVNEIGRAFKVPLGPEASQYEGWARVKPTDIDEVLSTYADAWKAMENRGARGVRETLGKARGILQRLTL